MNEEQMGADTDLTRARGIVIDRQWASAALLQRVMQVGYTNACQLIRDLQMEGVVGPSNGEKACDVLVPRPSSSGAASAG